MPSTSRRPYLPLKSRRTPASLLQRFQCPLDVGSTLVSELQPFYHCHSSCLQQPRIENDALLTPTVETRRSMFSGGMPPRAEAFCPRESRALRKGEHPFAEESSLTFSSGTSPSSTSGAPCLLATYTNGSRVDSATQQSAVSA